mmetsp:Transcript_21186/g.54244  ORF Transcript_21186/g.54244 Transcript_21186/m.54244 type:complete len:292 (-) Transcript_21186:541-1416(-)
MVAVQRVVRYVTAFSKALYRMVTILYQYLVSSLRLTVGGVRHSEDRTGEGAHRHIIRSSLPTCVLCPVTHRAGAHKAHAQTRNHAHGMSLARVRNLSNTDRYLCDCEHEFEHVNMVQIGCSGLISSTSRSPVFPLSLWPHSAASVLQADRLLEDLGAALVDPLLVRVPLRDEAREEAGRLLAHLLRPRVHQWLGDGREEVAQLRRTQKLRARVLGEGEVGDRAERVRHRLDALALAGSVDEQLTCALGDESRERHRRLGRPERLACRRRHLRKVEDDAARAVDDVVVPVGE